METGEIVTLQAFHSHKRKIPREFLRGFFLLEWSISHAARGCDGRQEGRERGYYYLHRNLDNTLLHTSPPNLYPILLRRRHQNHPC